ncbi:hypothetical protein O181_088946 [Austropuccinia psidii MF-1]|uniref:GAG-pre-integrase domain-containing protein n=1 Tax=Austropuccinia psidii MF-1 TaxID=1389203 RepID=A0A9Q3P7D6_9BASI|nr:hypothetical protein [Austropuccinia psidii MF-1]
MIFDCRRLLLDNFLFVPKLNLNLISLLRLFSEKLTIIKQESTFLLDTRGMITLRGIVDNNLMVVDYFLPPTLLTKASLYHNRLGHPGPTVINSMGLSIPKEDCHLFNNNKAHNKPLKSQFEHTKTPLKSPGQILCQSSAIDFTSSKRQAG